MRPLALGASVGLHLLAVLFFVNLASERERPLPPNVYQVTIVAAPPGARAGGQDDGVGSSRSQSRPQTQTKYVRTGRLSRELGRVSKDSARPGGQPAVNPAGKLPSPTPPDYGDDYGDYDGAEASAAGGRRGGGGGTPTASLVDTTAWQERVRAAVERVWRFPPELDKLSPNLMVTCSLTVNSGGALLAGHVLVPSGNGPFDRSVERALKTIRYLPAPPEGLMVGRTQLTFSMTFLPPEERR